MSQHQRRRWFNWNDTTKPFWIKGNIDEAASDGLYLTYNINPAMERNILIGGAGLSGSTIYTFANIGINRFKSRVGILGILTSGLFAIHGYIGLRHIDTDFTHINLKRDEHVKKLRQNKD